MTRAVFGPYRPPCTHDLNGRHPLVRTLLGAKSLIRGTCRHGIMRRFIPPYVANREHLTRLAARVREIILLLDRGLGSSWSNGKHLTADVGHRKPSRAEIIDGARPSRTPPPNDACDSPFESNPFKSNPPACS